MKSIEVLETGALTTIQDLGRFGYQKYGVPVSGGMDKFALRIANLLVGNVEGLGVLEMSMLGSDLKLLQDLTVAFTGGEFCPHVNGQPASMWCSLSLNKDDIISFPVKLPQSGFRAYMAVGGGIDAPAIMGSSSTHLLSQLGGYGRRLEKGDILSVSNSSIFEGSRSLTTYQIPRYPKIWKIHVIPGPQEDYFSAKGIKTFYSEPYEITLDSNRMGYRLEGPVIEHKHGADILSDATPSGSVQVPGDGKPIILLADGQTTGGYAKIGVVISPDQDLLAQSAIGNKLRFQQVNIVEAYRLIDEAEEKFKNIKNHITNSCRS